MHITRTPFVRSLALFASCALASCQGPETAPPAKLQPGTITVFPIVLAGQPSAQVAHVVGIFLERASAPGVELTEATFRPEVAADAPTEATAFGTFAQKQAVATDYALFADVRGTPGKGIDEVRSVLADKQGKVVWSEAWKKGDAVFDKRRMHEPMDCCLFVVERLRPVLGLQDPNRRGAPEGKLAARMAEKSGAPSDAERTAMATRLEALRELGTKAKVLVLPPRCGKDWSKDGAQALAKALTASGLVTAEAATAPVEFSVTPDSNEQAVLWGAAKALQAALKKGPARTDYVLCADFLMAAEGKAGAVHTFLFDPAGELVWVDFQNSHHADFQATNPTGIDGCAALSGKRAIAALRR